VHLVAACGERHEQAPGTAHHVERRTGIGRQALREPGEFGLRRVGLQGVVEERRERTER
jgi:hypothetical protein